MGRMRAPQGANGGQRGVWEGSGHRGAPAPPSLRTESASAWRRGVRPISPGFEREVFS